MKKILFCLSVLLCVAGCYRYDDSQLKKDIQDLQEELASKDSLVRFVSYDKQLVKNGDIIELVLAPSVTEEIYVGLQADVVSNSGTVTAIATKSGAEYPWKIKALNPKFGADGKVSKNPAVVIVNAGEYLTDAFLKVYLIDNEGQSHVATKAITGGERPVADRIVYGNIYTADEMESIVEAFAVKKDRFLYVGTKEEARQYAGPATEVIDFGDRGLVIPGCTEGHGHFIGVEGVATMLPGFKASYEELVNTIIPQKMKSKPGPFVSFGWATEKVSKDNKTDYAGRLDEFSKEYPIVLIDGGGHNALCNTVALRKAGLLKENGEKLMDVRGGDILTLGETGKPTGYITDEVIPYVINKAVGALLDDDQYHQACVNAVKALNERGFTSYLDAAINYLDEEARAYKYAHDLDVNGDFTVNMIGYYNIRSYDWGFPKGGTMPETVKNRLDYIGTLVKNYSSRHVIANGVKLFADGVTDTGTGWISEEYMIEDLPADKKHGNIIWKQEELDAIVAAANERGMPVHTHTFGDMACEAVINAYCASNTASSLTVPNSLAHVRNIKNNDIVRCATNGIAIASNIIWHAGDPDWALEVLLSYIPKNIYESGYPMKSLLDAGIVVSSSTDSPAGTTPGTVPNIIGVAVNGISPEFPDANPLNPGELLTVREVLRCLTINGAISLGLQDERGSIEVGKYADFVVLDNNVLEQEKTNKKDIFNTKVASTWFEGQRVYPK